MPEKKGLKPEHHGELNKPSEVYPGVKRPERKELDNYAKSMKEIVEPNSRLIYTNQAMNTINGYMNTERPCLVAI